MFRKYRYENWTNHYPSNIFEYLLSPVSRRMRIVNLLFQKVFRINSEMPFMVHFTSTVFGDIRIGRDLVRTLANSGGCYIQGINGIVIGDFTIIAPGVKIISANHSMTDYSQHKKGQPIIIGKSCWLGANCIVLPGVQLGDNVVVAAGSVVTSSFPSNTVVAGNPARIIKSI